MSILLKTVRVHGFRALQNIEVNLNKTTVLTGMNNSGKTSFLKAIQLAFGNYQFLTQDDFYTHNNETQQEIIVDTLFVPVDDKENEIASFAELWELLFTIERIRTNTEGETFLPVRTKYYFDQFVNGYKFSHYILNEWPSFNSNGSTWYQYSNQKEISFHFDEIPFFYVNPQRDIIEDTKYRNSYLGKIISKVEYSQDDIDEIEDELTALNEKVINKSEVLSDMRDTLMELDTTMDATKGDIEITPLTKNVRDFNKGIKIYYQDNIDSFSMDYHGMGTRSWATLLTLKSLVLLLEKNARKQNSVIFPILAIEEPEAHLHPNAQRKLLGQILEIPGQKIISTHSPYIVSQTKLQSIRNFYKSNPIVCGLINEDSLKPSDTIKIERRIINKRGEILFSRLIILFEGETEDLALPIFSNHIFGDYLERGINFVSVDGYTNYLPYLQFCESFSIPWLVFSDAENTKDCNVKENVKEQFKKSNTNREEKDCIIFLDDGNSFEKQLIDDGFVEEIKKAIINSHEYKNKYHEKAKIEEINNYTDQEVLDIICKKKTLYASEIAEQIILSGKKLPKKIIELFTKIDSVLTLNEVSE